MTDILRIKTVGDCPDDTVWHQVGGAYSGCSLRHNRYFATNTTPCLEEATRVARNERLLSGTATGLKTYPVVAPLRHVVIRVTEEL